jgi:hypothetical protein
MDKIWLWGSLFKSLDLAKIGPPLSITPLLGQLLSENMLKYFKKNFRAQSE